MVDTKLIESFQVRVINANMEFMNGHTIIDGKKTPLLCHTTDPEIKRKIIGDTFMAVANRIIEEMNLDPDKVNQFLHVFVCEAKSQ